MSSEKETVKSVSLLCEHCGGTLTVDEGREILACPFCGNKTLIVENDAVTIEKIRASANKEIEFERIRSNERLLQVAEEKRLEEESKKQVEKFRKGKFSKFLIIAVFICAFCAYICFARGQILAGVLLVLQTLCFGVAWVLGMQIIKEKKRYIYVLIALVGVVLIIPSARACTAQKEKVVEEIEWSILDMGDMIPEPKSTKIDISLNSAERLSIDVYDMTENDCYAYMKECEKEYNYNIDVDKVSSTFSAYNSEGYKLFIVHVGDYMSISLDCPVEFEEYEFPDYAIQNGLPLPKSEVGHYEWKYDDNFNVKIGNTTEEDYKEYVSSCIEAGFIKDSQEGKQFYNGSNESGYKISVSYLGFNTMSIDFDSPKAEEEPTPTPEQKEEITKTPEIPNIPDIDAGTVDPEFKAMMDSYEQFFNEYVDFINSYTSADPMEALNMLESYSSYMEQYAEALTKLGEINQGDLSTAELLYYTEVTKRIYDRLGEIGQ